MFNRIVGPAAAAVRAGLGPEFRKLWLASACSSLEDGMTSVAAPLLAAALTQDAALVAGLAFAQRLPWLGLSLFSGALADRLDRRQAMAVVTVLRASLIACVGTAVLLHAASLPLLYVVFFLIGCGETLFDVSAAAALPSIVPTAALPRANARLSGTITLGSLFVGRPLGGALFALAAALPFLAGTAALAAAATLIAGLRGTFKVQRANADAPPGGLRAEIATGVRWLLRHRLLRTLSIATALLNLTLVAENAIIVLYAEQRLGLGAEGFALLVSVYGAGGVLGSLVAHRWLTWLGASGGLRAAVVAETAYPLAMALVSSAALAGLVFVLFGVHAVIFGALSASLRQELAPPALRGRVESATRFLEEGLAAPGALLGGLMAVHFGLTAPFWLGAAIGAGLLVLVWQPFSPAAVRAARARGSLDG